MKRWTRLHCGHHVCSASGAKEALDLLEQQPFDVMVTDHAMPGMTGAQLLTCAWKSIPMCVQ
ncbi:response regulator [Pseudomonas sp. NPDC090208]|uniref:response regulator n=1 Tax=Pseudomonas sp. NPDC090208 TaxID=3364478 RepID=UPI00380A2A8A